jgi:hypothetical protein
MRPLILLPAAAFLALAACGDDQDVAQTEPEATTTAPADTAAAPPPATTDTAPPAATATAPPPATDTAPAQDTAAAPPATDTTMTDPQATGAVAAGGAIEPGVYQSQNVSLNLEQDGTFLMTNTVTGDDAQGQYQLQDDVLTLMTEGMPDEPMTCDLVPAGDGFEISATDPSCEPLDGESFQRQG